MPGGLGPRPACLSVLLLVLSAQQAARSRPAVAAAAPRPDIVVIYMDDFSPQVATALESIWMTPALARFVMTGFGCGPAARRRSAVPRAATS